MMASLTSNPTKPSTHSPASRLFNSESDINLMSSAEISACFSGSKPASHGIEPDRDINLVASFIQESLITLSSRLWLDIELGKTASALPPDFHPLPPDDSAAHPWQSDRWCCVPLISGIEINHCIGVSPQCFASSVHHRLVPARYSVGSGGFHGLYMEPFMPTLAKLRLAAFHRQNGRCFYCHLPMWTTDPLTFAAQYRLSAAQARRFQCTAEHLIARQDGGKDLEGNIVAACRFCNQTRHKRKSPPDAESYCALVAKRVTAGRWHFPEVLRRLGPSPTRAT